MQVVQDITGNENITYEQVEAVNDALPQPEKIFLKFWLTGGIEGLDADLVEGN